MSCIFIALVYCSVYLFIVPVHTFLCDCALHFTTNKTLLLYLRLCTVALKHSPFHYCHHQVQKIVSTGSSAIFDNSPQRYLYRQNMKFYFYSYFSNEIYLVSELKLYVEDGRPLLISLTKFTVW